MRSLSGKVAIVTGGSRGIGAAIAIRLAAEGAQVVVNYLQNQAAALEIVARIQREGGKSNAIQADVSRAEDVRRLFAEAVSAYGGLDILVSNAAQTHTRPVSIADTSDEVYERFFDVNVRGTFLCLREAIRHIRPGGRIVTLSSSGTAAPHPGFSAYTAAKSAVEIFTQSLCKELRGRDVTVNCVSPGAIATEQWLEGKPEEVLQRVAGLSPMNRIGEPVDVANVVAFLAGPESEWVNGQVLRVNGGFL